MDDVALGDYGVIGVTLVCLMALIGGLIGAAFWAFIASWIIGFNNPIITPSIISIIVFLIGLSSPALALLLSLRKNSTTIVALIFIVIYYLLFIQVMPMLFGSEFVVFSII